MAALNPHPGDGATRSHITNWANHQSSSVKSGDKHDAQLAHWHQMCLEIWQTIFIVAHLFFIFGHHFELRSSYNLAINEWLTMLFWTHDVTFSRSVDKHDLTCKWQYNSAKMISWSHVPMKSRTYVTVTGWPVIHAMRYSWGCNGFLVSKWHLIII